MASAQPVQPAPVAGKAKTRKTPERRPMSGTLRMTAAIDRLISTGARSDARAAITFAVIRLGGGVTWND